MTKYSRYSAADAESGDILPNKVNISDQGELSDTEAFREGNGRTIRLFIDLITVSQGYHLIDYEYSGKEAYFKACAEGVYGDNQPMQELIFNGLFIV